MLNKHTLFRTNDIQKSANTSLNSSEELFSKGCKHYVYVVMINSER